MDAVPRMLPCPYRAHADVAVVIVERKTMTPMPRSRG